ncbi:MAG: Adenylate cyclase [Acidimicrobiales bacterium]|nr:Adenylate cyclase [Acidimicrobiales bacterium]
MTCAACGATASDDARFCASCGRALRAVEDERRVVTVLFADLVGFTSLSERLDPERLKNLVDRCFDRLAVDVTSFGGQVDKIVGDAMVALFGAPTAHEDDAERAVRAALRMQQTLCEEAEQIGQELRIRIGVNTGEVLVGAMRAAGSVTAMGDVVNTASRLQTAAQPGEVLVGPATHAATHHTIAYEPRGLVAAKGRDEPVDTWVAVAPTLPPGSRVRRVDVPLVGRGHEVGLLQQAVDASVRHGRALLALVIGDVGMGKSRLADEVASWSVDTHQSVVREGRCVPYGEANVWWPVAEALRAGLGVRDGDNAAAARDAVRTQVATAMRRKVTDPEVQRTAEGLLTLMGHDPAPGADPTTVREEAGRALATYASASAELRPLVLQLSDLHWADDAVLDLIDDVFQTVHHLPVVILATARPALLDRWTARPGRHNSIVLHLDPLERRDAADLLEVLVGSAVPPAVVEALLDRSGGNPFFLEELVSLLDGEDANAPGLVAALPDTLRGLVAARLDDLTPAQRSVLQDAAVIGQRGPMVGLREMSRHLHRGIDVDECMRALVADDIMRVEGESWGFRSDLVREVAYQTITKADRAKSHLGIAQYVEHTKGSEKPRPPWVVDQLAHHYGAAVALAAELGPDARTAAFPADLADQARRWVVEAADRARRDQALPTAVRLYGQALVLLDGDPAADDRAELDPAADRLRGLEGARLHLARAEVAAEAWDLPVARRAVEAACSLAERLGDPSVAAQALVVRGTVEQHEGDMDAAVATLTTAAGQFAQLDDLRGLAGALRQRAMVEIFAGRIDDAGVSASEALAAFERSGDKAGQGWASQNLAWIAFVTGRVDEADRRLQTSIDLFSELVDTRGLAWSLGLLAWVRFQQRRVGEARALGEQVLDEARARNDPWASSMMTLLLSSIQLWSGGTTEAVEMAERTLRGFQGIGDQYGTGQASAVLGRALVMAGRVDEGFDLLAKAGGPHGQTNGGPAAARGQVARFTRLATAVQVGEPERGTDAIDELSELELLGGDDPAVLLGLYALQRGDVDEAVRHLGLPGEHTDDGNLGAARALLAAASGSGHAGELADAVSAMPAATYLDRALAEIAAAMEAAACDAADRSDSDSTVGRRITAARTAVDPTGDALARALVALAAAKTSARLGAADALDTAAAADRHLAKLGITAHGWGTLFDLALAGHPEPVDAS